MYYGYFKEWSIQDKTYYRYKHPLLANNWEDAQLECYDILKKHPEYISKFKTHRLLANNWEDAQLKKHPEYIFKFKISLN